MFKKKSFVKTILLSAMIALALVACSSDSSGKELIAHVAYEVSGDKLSDKEIKESFEKLYASSHEVFYWFYDSATPLEPDKGNDKIIEDKEGKWRPIKKIETLAALKEVSETVFSRGYCEKMLYSLNRFKDIEGRLYEKSNAGGYADPYKPNFKSLEILSKSPQSIKVKLDIGSGLNSKEVKTSEFEMIKQNDCWVLDGWIK